MGGGKNGLHSLELSGISDHAQLRRRTQRSSRHVGVVASLALAAACHQDSVTGPNGPNGTACGDGSVLRLSPNQATTLVCGSSGKSITLTGGAKYLIVPQFATGSPTAGVADVPVAYQIGVPTTSSSALKATRSVIRVTGSAA
jgi:hypothetical protein